MTTTATEFLPGNLVRARGREWVVQSDTRLADGASALRLRPLGGSDDDVITLLPENTPLPASDKMTYLLARLEVGPSRAGCRPRRRPID
jgi:hypothetical protein